MVKTENSRTKHGDIAAAWLRVTEPVRPSNADIKFFGRVLGSKLKPNVLVLGLTPELIDAALAISPRKISVIEIRQRAIRELVSLASQDWSSVDFIPASWMDELPDLHASFDVIVAHGSFVHLRYPSQWLGALRILRHYLAKDGRIALKLFSRPYFTQSVHERLSEYRSHILEIAETGETSSHRDFASITTVLKLSALSESILPSGEIDQQTLEIKIKELSREVRRLISGTELWEVFSSDYDAATPRDYDGVIPLSAPSINKCIELFCHAGFDVDVSECPDTRFVGAFHYIVLSIKD